MGDDDGAVDIWASPCTQFVLNRILVTFPKLSLGAKFDKAFQTEANRSVLYILYCLNQSIAFHLNFIFLILNAGTSSKSSLLKRILNVSWLPTTSNCPR